MENKSTRTSNQDFKVQQTRVDSDQFAALATKINKLNLNSGETLPSSSSTPVKLPQLKNLIKLSDDLPALSDKPIFNLKPLMKVQTQDIKPEAKTNFSSAKNLFQLPPRATKLDNKPIKPNSDSSNFLMIYTVESAKTDQLRGSSENSPVKPMAKNQAYNIIAPKTLPKPKKLD